MQHFGERMVIFQCFTGCLANPYSILLKQHSTLRNACCLWKQEHLTAVGEHGDQTWDVFLSVRVQSESKCVIRFFCGLPKICAKLLCTKTNHIGFQSPPPKSEKGQTELVQLWQQPHCQRTRVSNLEIPRRLGNEEWLSERGEEMGDGRSVWSSKHCSDAHLWMGSFLQEPRYKFTSRTLSSLTRIIEL
jgi:hypothetical protein